MKVNELIEHLKKLVEEDQAVGEFRVVMSADAEGNCYSELSGMAIGRVEGEDAWNLEFQGDEKDWASEYGDDEPYPGGNCVTVWPT